MHVNNIIYRKIQVAFSTGKPSPLTPPKLFMPGKGKRYHLNINTINTAYCPQDYLTVVYKRRDNGM